MHRIQQKLLQLIDCYPLGAMTYRRIGDLVGLRDRPATVKHHLDQLQKKGLITIDIKKKVIARIQSGIVNATNLISIPILGAANCGAADLFATENIQGHVQVSPKILGKSLLRKAKHLFALHAKGHSMNAANIKGETIEEGDYVIVDGSSKAPHDGDCVVSIIDGCANIKRWYTDRKNHRIILVSESTEKMPPVYIHEDDFHEVMINGTIALVMKTPEDFSAFLESSARDTFGSLPMLSKDEYDYYCSLPDRK